MRSLMIHEIRVRRRTILGWTVALAFFAAMYMAFYPALPDEMRNLDMGSIDIYKSMGVQTMATFDGYMQSTVFNFLPLLAAVFGLLLGTGALAGEEDAGTIEHLAALPISRVQLYAAKAIAVIAAAFFVMLAAALVVAGVFLVIEGKVDTSVTALDLASVVVAHGLIAFVFLSLGLCLGALLPSRGMANAVASVVLVLTFFGNNLAGMVEVLERVQPLFPFHYFGSIAQSLTGDMPWADVLVLLAMGLGALLLGAVGFRGRNLTVGAWGWLHAPGGRGGPWDVGTLLHTRRVIVPLAVVGLAACACAGVGAIAWAGSDDVRQAVRDRLGLDGEDVVRESGDLVPGWVPVDAPAPGRVVAVEVTAGDVVAAGDVLVVLADPGEPALRVAAQDVLERAWTLLDELATGAPDAERPQLEAAIARAGTAAAAADRAWREARLGTGSAGSVDALETRAEFAWSAQRVAEARLALAEGDLSDADIAAVEAAVETARSYLRGSGAQPVLRPIPAPLGGTVGEILVLADAMVTEGQSLVRISDPDSFEVSIRVGESDAERMKAGSDADIEVDGFDDPFDGEVLEVFRAAAPAAGEDAEEADERPFVVRIAVDDRGGDLEVGTSVEVRVALD
jgi:ABC-2 type transport system permease protein